MTPAAKIKWSVLGAVICLAGGAGWVFFGQTKPAGATRQQPTPPRSPPLTASAAPVRAPELIDPLPAEFAAATAETSDEEFLRLARIIVDRSPAQALRWAQSQTDATLRDRWLFAVLRAWGEQDPRAAVYWALQQDESRRFAHMEAAFAGAVAQPDVALQLGRELLAADLTSGSAYGLTLVGALSAAGKFPEALQFANAGPAEARGDWLENIFHRWGENHPEDAVTALRSIENQELHDAAFQALIAGWSAGNPPGLAAYALTMPAGEDRIGALNSALENWCQQDPAAVGEWLNALPASAELDRAVSWLVTRTDSVNRAPQVALTWLPEIHDSILRRDALIHLMQEWAQADADVAWKQFREIPWLGETERAEIRTSIEKKIEVAHANTESP